MNQSLRLQESNTRQQSGVLYSLQILGRILHSLSDFLQVTEEELRDAGVYLGNQH
jgi:hypothetical protein